MHTISKKHFLIGSIIIAFAFILQPFMTLFTQVSLGPKLGELLERMKTDPRQALYESSEIDMQMFQMCQSDPSTAKIVADDQALGESLGVTGTPSTFIGKRDAEGNIGLYKDAISGALPKESVLQAINNKNKILTSTVIKNENLHIYGNPNAETMLVEFSDLECPFCGRFHPTITSIVDESNGKVAYAYKHFPLPSHANAVPLAIASECISKQRGSEGFFQFIDATFSGM